MNIVKKFHEVNVNITKLLHILRKLTIRKLNLRSRDLSKQVLCNPSLRSPKNPNENFKLKRNLRWPTTRTLDLPSSTRVHGGSLSLIGHSLPNLLQWTSVVLLAHTIYGRLEAKLTSLIVLFYFRYHNNIRLLRIRGKLN